MLYYAQDNSVFHLPERELTDEELLQIIDFQTKRDYVLSQRTSQEYEEQRREAREEIAAEGGITEEKAIELGKEWLNRLYGITGEGMELNHYPDTDGDRHSYNVNFSIQSHEYYYCLLYTSVSLKSIRMQWPGRISWVSPYCSATRQPYSTYIIRLLLKLLRSIKKSGFDSYPMASLTISVSSAKSLRKGATWLI